MKAKQMRRGLSDLAEEGVIRLFKPVIGSQWIVGVIGELQLDVLATRLEQEYSGSRSTSSRRLTTLPGGLAPTIQRSSKS